MSEYKGIRGFTVQTVSTDPAASVVASGSWASGTSMNNARTTMQSSSSGTSDAFVGGGYSAGRVTFAEVYNGTNWTEVTEMNGQRMFGQGAGTSTAGIITGGDGPTGTPSNVGWTELWNGSTWTEVSDMSTARKTHSLTGTTTAALAAGSYPASTAVENYNGTSWTATTSLNTGKNYMVGTGSSTAALVTGTPATTEQWNGSTWTEVTDSNTDHRSGAASGISTDALFWGGDNGPGYVVNTEYWNGSSWTELNNLATGRAYTGGTENAPGSSAALAYGGSTPTQVATMEVWTTTPAPTFSKENPGQVYYNSTSNAFKVTKSNSGAPLGTWASGGTTNTGVYAAETTGTLTAGLKTGGYVAPTTATISAAETYDGTSWTSITSMPTSLRYFSSFGLQTSSIFVGGSTGPGISLNGVAQEYNGSWSTGGTLNTVRRMAGGAGSSISDGIIFGGASGSPDASTQSLTAEVYNGTSWTEVADRSNYGYNGLGSTGTSSTAAIGMGGHNTAVATLKAEVYNGTSWTEVADLNSQKTACTGGFGTSTDAITAYSQAPQTTEHWNGSTWTSLSGVTASAVDSTTGTGNQSNSNSGFITTGNPVTYYQATEEWNAPAPFATNETITVS